MKKVAIVGYGYVGRGVHRLFKDWVTAIVDPRPLPEAEEEAKTLGYQGNMFSNVSSVIDKVDLAVVCVPTEQREDGGCDTTIVERVVHDLVATGIAEAILIKSTVKPGTTDRLIEETGFKKMAFSPEYMGEGGYFTPFWKYPDPREMKMHTFQIFGGPREGTSVMVDIFQGKMGPHVFYAQTEAKIAEFVKYWENVWGAMKVTFSNEMYNCAEAVGVDYREARELWALDSRVEKMHTAVFTDKRGYAGKCYPKDIAAFINFVREAGYEPELIAKIPKVNNKIRRENGQEEVKDNT